MALTPPNNKLRSNLSISQYCAIDHSIILFITVWEDFVVYTIPEDKNNIICRVICDTLVQNNDKAMIAEQSKHEIAHRVNDECVCVCFKQKVDDLERCCSRHKCTRCILFQMCVACSHELNWIVCVLYCARTVQIMYINCLPNTRSI